MRTQFILIPALVLGLSACQTRDQTTAAGALAGAAVGAAVSNKDDRVVGAALGAAAGVAASTLIGPAQSQGQCYYRNSRGERFIAAC